MDIGNCKDKTTPITACDIGPFHTEHDSGQELTLVHQTFNDNVNNDPSATSFDDMPLSGTFDETWQWPQMHDTFTRMATFHSLEYTAEVQGPV